MFGGAGMPEKMLLEMNGTVEQIVYRNEKNQYTVLEVNNGQELVTVVGCMPFLSVGEELHVVGTWGTTRILGRNLKPKSVSVPNRLRRPPCSNTYRRGP